MRMLNSIKMYQETHFSVHLSVAAPSDSAETTEAQGQCLKVYFDNQLTLYKTLSFYYRTT